MKKMKTLSLILSIAMIITLFAGCGGGSQGSTSGDGGDIPASIKVGILNPTTGPLAGMGEGLWVDDWFKSYINDELGGIYIADYDAKIPVEFITYDTASSSVNASDLTAKLITEDKVDVIIARHTPDNVVPISNVAEQYGVPCIATDCPAGPWLANGPHEWSFLAAVDSQTYYNAYSSIWKAAGFKPGDANSTIGLIFANDTDGTVLGPDYKAAAEADGYKTLDPGQYSAGTNDFSSLIADYKKNDIKIIFGTMINPEFGAFWAQSQQLDFAPSVVVVGKAYMLESQVDAIGRELMDGICNEVWWDPTFPYTSALTGASAQAFADEYFAANGTKAAGPQGAKYAALEVLVDVLTRSANLEPETIRDAIAATDLDTIMGHFAYNDENHCPTVCVGGQWRLQDDGSMTQEIVGNPDPSNGIKTTAEIKITGLAWQK
jgi:branched-chain amino acid transport system substrate-binding protein